jgi:hypothetical protein
VARPGTVEVVPSLIESIVALNEHGDADAIRYVAVRDGTAVDSWQRDGVADPSSSESDLYEELFTNPSLLATAEARGAVGCGGVRYLVVAYGQFSQIVIRNGVDGHVSICVESTADAERIAGEVMQLLHHPEW